MNQKKWLTKDSDPDLEARLSHELGIQRVTASILIRRGIRNKDEGRRFLKPSPDSLIDPFLLPDMDRAVERILKAVRGKELVAIYGDYDVDGITATSLFLEWFKRLGHPTTFYIPHRMREGYGLNSEAIRFLHRQGVKVLITADCGTTSFSENHLAQSLGMDVIVTDHHETVPLPGNGPPEWSLVNPKRSDSHYGYEGLCTAGLAYKMIQALESELRSSDWDMKAGLDLVALGTLADVSPIMGENRFLVREGLSKISEESRPGIKALKAVAGMQGREVGCGAVGFGLAPRINAVGRLSDAREGVRLLTTRSYEEAQHIAAQLEGWNRERQRIEQGIVDHAERQMERDKGLGGDACAVLASTEWHVGVVGIGASRIAEQYGCPAVLIAIDEQGVGRGSARSIPGFNIQKALASCEDILIRFGGHRQAAGLTIREEQIPALRRRLSDYALDFMGDTDRRPTLKVDGRVNLEDLSFPLIRELESLRPHGVGNPEPTFVLENADLLYPRVIGNNHLKFKVRNGKGQSFSAIAFRMGKLAEMVRGGERFHIAYTPEIQTWQGEEQIQLRVKDIQRPSL